MGDGLTADLINTTLSSIEYCSKTFYAISPAYSGVVQAAGMLGNQDMIIFRISLINPASMECGSVKHQLQRKQNRSVTRTHFNSALSPYGTRTNKLFLSHFLGQNLLLLLLPPKCAAYSRIFKHFLDLYQPANQPASRSAGDPLLLRVCSCLNC